MASDVKLKRSLGLLSLTFYGLGTIVGAGIYVLIGEVAAVAGTGLPISFLFAGIVAAFTVFSYAELSCRFPYCAGEVIFADEAWQLHRLSALLGWLIVLTGTVSAAAVAKGFIGYLEVFVNVDPNIAIIGLIVFLAALASWGMRASVITIFLITLIELAGLLYVIIYAFSADVPMAVEIISFKPSTVGFSGILLGSFLAFYAFIGFEDMVNIIEEVKNPQKTFPLAIILALCISIAIYFLVAIAALRINTPQQLAESNAPLALLISTAGGNPGLIAIISLFAVINGGLVQIIMASRVLYGMANKKMAPYAFSRLNSTTHTPIYSTFIVAFCVLIFALTFPLAKLAQFTSLIMLSVFVIVNCSLIAIKRKSTQALTVFCVPLWVPIIGAFSASMLTVLQLWISVSNTF